MCLGHERRQRRVANHPITDTGDRNQRWIRWFIRNVISNADYIWLCGAQDIPGRRDCGGVVPFRAGSRSTMPRPGAGFAIKA
jgi:hypothetical protein